MTAFFDLLRVFTGDERFKEIEEKLLKLEREGKVITMCMVVDRFMEKVRIAGMEGIMIKVEICQELGLSKEATIESPE